MEKQRPNVMLMVIYDLGRCYVISQGLVFQMTWK